MTREELKQKLVDVLQEAMKPVEYGGDPSLGIAPEVRYPTDGEIADVLIDKVIQEVIDEGAYKIKYETELAEKVARRACEMVVSDEVYDEEFEDAFYLYKLTHGINEWGVDAKTLYGYLKEKVKKEWNRREPQGL